MSRLLSLCRGGALCALLACAGDAVADSKPAVSSLPQWVMRAQERLELQPYQQHELRRLVDGNAERIDALRQRYAGDTAEGRRAQRVALSSLQEEFRAGLAGILSPTQLAEWDALVEELLGRVHLRQGPRVAGAH